MIVQLPAEQELENEARVGEVIVVRVVLAAHGHVQVELGQADVLVHVGRVHPS